MGRSYPHAGMPGGICSTLVVLVQTDDVMTSPVEQYSSAMIHFSSVSSGKNSDGVMLQVSIKVK